MKRFVSTFLGTDSPRASDIFGSGLLGVVLTLTVCATDRMNRRKVKDVKSHARDVLQPFLTFLEGPESSGFSPARSREHLVPRAKPSSFTIDNHRKFLAVNRGLAAICVQYHPGRQFDIGKPLHCIVQVLFLEPQDLARPGRQPPGVFTARTICSRLNQLDACEQVQGDVLAGFQLFGEIPTPGLKRIQPGFECVKMYALRGDNELSLPAIVYQWLHRHFFPVPLGNWTMQQNSTQDIVTIGIDVCRDFHMLTDCALNRKTPA